MEELDVRVAKVEERCKSNSHRIDELQDQMAVFTKVAMAVEVMAAEQKHQTKAMSEIKADVGKMEGKLDALEAAPGRRWNGVVEKVIAALVGGVVGYFLLRLGM